MSVKNTAHKNLFRGAVWTIGMRWSMRAIGFVNVLILARLLTPSDFGIVAMATIVSGFASSFAEFGAQQLLIRQRDVTRSDIDSAWTVHILQGLLVASIIFFSAPYIAVFFKDERLIPVAYWMAVSAIILGFRNIGLTLARKEMDFALDFRAQVYTKIIGFFLTLTLVLVLRDYWALVYGQMATAVVTVLISYLIHPYRPKISFEKLRNYLIFSLSIIPLRIATFGNKKVPLIFVGNIADVAQVGIFNVSNDLAKMMTGEIAVPLSRGLFPGFAKMNDDMPALAQAFQKSLAISVAIIAPLGVGLAVVADDVIPLVLGQQWLDTIVFVKWLSLAAVVGSVNQLLSSQILIVSGHESRSAILSWVKLGVLTGAVVVASSLGGALSIAMACLAVSLFFLPVSAMVLANSIPITVREIFLALWRPAVSSFLMWQAVIFVNPYLDTLAVIRLFADVCVGGIVYIATYYVTWLLIGRPDGLEQMVLSQLVTRWRKFRRSSVVQN